MSETVTGAQLRRAMWTVQREHRFFPGTDHVNMLGPMVVWIDDHSQAIQAERRWHGSKLS